MIKTKRLIRFLSNIFFYGLMLILLVTVFFLVQSRIAGGPPAVFGYQFYVVLGGSMSPTFEAGSVAVVRPVAPETIAVGDIITYHSASGGSSLTTHRVREVYRENGSLRFITRGDANDVDDHFPVYPENIKGRVVAAVPYLGFLLHFVRSRQGLLLLIVVPAALVIIFEIRNLLRYAAEAERQEKEQAPAEDSGRESRVNSGAHNLDQS